MNDAMHRFDRKMGAWRIAERIGVVILGVLLLIVAPILLSLWP